MGSFSIWHWLIVLVVVVLVFGTKKLRNFGSDLGSAVKGFKEGMQADQNKKDSANIIDNPVDLNETKEKSATHNKTN